MGGRDYVGVSREMSFFRVDGDWRENTITWNNRPSYSQELGRVSSTYDFVGPLQIDLTTQVRAWVSGAQPNHGMVAIGPESPQGVYRVLASSETDHSPKLRISYVNRSLSPVLDVWPGDVSLRVARGRALSVSALHIQSIVGSSLNWSATNVGDSSWLQLQPAHGSVNPATPQSLVLGVNTTGLQARTYNGQVRVSSSTSGVIGSPTTVNVRIDVVDQPQTIYLPLVSGSPAPQPPEIVALVVGISDYKYLDPAPTSSDALDGWGRDLVWAAVDAQKFANALVASGGSVKPTSSYLSIEKPPEKLSSRHLTTSAP